MLITSALRGCSAVLASDSMGTFSKSVGFIRGIRFLCLKRRLRFARPLVKGPSLVIGASLAIGASLVLGPNYG